MKKLLVSIGVLAVLVIGFNVVSNEYRVEFRAWALNMEAEKGGLEVSTIEIDGKTMTYYQNQAEGPVMVMLHGFSGNKTNWLRLAQSLDGRYKLVIPDLLGHGDNDWDVGGSYHIADQVAYVNKLMAKLNVAKFHLVGNSMGGAISSLYAATHPQQVLSLTLISPAGVHDIPSALDEGLEKGQNLLIPTTEQEFYQVIDFVMSEPPFIPAAIAKAEAEISVSRLEINRKIFKDIRSDLELNLDQKFAAISAPTLIIWGDQDQAINVANIEKYAELIKGARKEVIEGIGHVAMIEVPAYTAELMLDFLSK